jgi:hypothetical protein
MSQQKRKRERQMREERLFKHFVNEIGEFEPELVPRQRRDFASMQRDTIFSHNQRLQTQYVESGE